MSVNIFESIAPSAPMAGPMGEAPPPYSTLPVGCGPVDMSGLAAWGSGSIAASAPPSVGYNSVGMKLSYMDFVPQLLRKRLIGKNEYDTFSNLMARANQWLEDHSDLQLIACETVTWFGATHKDIFSDSTLFRKAAVVTFLRGLRFWYMTKVVPSPGHAARRAQLVQCQTVTARPSETFTQLMSRVNDIVSKGSARVISVETVRFHVTDEVINTEETVWREDITDSKHVLFAFRVYTQLLDTPPTRQTIGYQDFVPSRTNRSKENRGYELYADVMDRAARWIARQQGVRFTNIQSVSLKIKKVSDQSFEERCSFTEHGRRVTNFLSVIRAYFVIEQGGPGELRVERPSARLTYRTFSPAQISVATSSAAPKYEDARNVVDRINLWLQLTGASLFAMETIPCRMVTGSQQALGTEATFLPSQDDGTPAGKFLFHIRIYLNGDYVEPPQAVAILFPPNTYVY